MRKIRISYFLLCFLCVALPDLVFAGQSSFVRTGNRQYRKGDYAAALESYQKALEKDPDSDIINFNIGTTLYQQQDHQGAITHLQKALLTEDANLQQKTAYNLGNAFYQKGKAREQADIDGAIADLEKSLSHLQRSIDLDGKDEDAQHNYTFVQKELEQLRQKKEQQSSNCPLPKRESSSQDAQQKDEQQGQPQDNKEDGQQQGQPQSRDQDQKKEQEGPSASASSEDQPRSGDPSQDDQGAQSSAKDGPESRVSQGAQGFSQGAGPMTRKQAEAAIANYQQNEEPQGMFYLLRKTSQDNTVEKDW